MYSTSHYSPPPTYAYQEIRPNSHAFTTNTATAYTFSARPQTMFYTATDDKRRTSYTYTTSPRLSSYLDPPAYASTTNTTYKVKTSTAPTRRTEQPSAAERLRSRARSFVERDSIKLAARSSPSKKSRPQSYAQTQSRRESVHIIDEKKKDDVFYYSYSPKGSPPPPYERGSDRDWSSPQMLYEKEKSTRSRQPSPPDTKPTRQRRDTTTQTPPPPRPTEKKSSTSKSAKATPADASRAGIPAGYSYKNWDPTEAPIYLLGSVFDASSLGKWVYDWTVYAHGPSSPLADMAGDLWLLLIQLAGKMKRAEARVERVRRRTDRELVEEFIEGGDRLWARLKKILKACEDFMWRASKADRRGSSAGVAMGAKSGSEFVESMFGRDRRLEETEKLMTSLRLWNYRFDVNCEDVLRHPLG